MKQPAWRRIHSTFLILPADQEIFDRTYGIRGQARIPVGDLLEDQISDQVWEQPWRQK